MVVLLYPDNAFFFGNFRYAKINHNTHFLFDEQELRIEDYEAGRKKEVYSVCTISGSLFGNTSAPRFSTSSSLIGLQPTTGFAAAGLEIFLLKLINNSSSQNTENYISEGGLDTRS